MNLFKKPILFFSILTLLFCLGIYYYSFQKKDSYSKKIYTNEFINTKGNPTIQNFRVAKKILNKIYQDELTGTEFYCGCPFYKNTLDIKHCDYKPHNKENQRSYHVEWEHIVPASRFGKKFKSWNQGDPKCFKKNNKKPFKGRKCAKLVSKMFRYMEADLYNLVPAVGEINSLRKNYPMGIIQNTYITFGNCKTRIGVKTIQPREEIRGFIARVYLYMEYAYPNFIRLKKHEKELFQTWNQKYPVSKDEKQRNKKIFNIQKNINPFI